MNLCRPALATALTAAAITVAGCAAGNTNTTQTASTTPSVSPSGPANAPALEQAYVSVVAKVLPSVVLIRTPDGLGSGVVLDRSGNIVTNAHVAGSATKFGVQVAGVAGGEGGVAGAHQGLGGRGGRARVQPPAARVVVVTEAAGTRASVHPAILAAASCG